MANAVVEANRDWASDVKTDTRNIAALGYLAVVIFIGLFGIWGATVPLSGAAIVPGVVAASGRNQVVQHLEGGIIREIHVREGDRVAAGDPLFTLDATQAQATLNTLTKNWINLRARKARLEAQRDAAADVAFDDDLVAAAANAGLSNVLDEQRAEFNARAARFRSESVLLDQRIAAGSEAITGFQSQKTALEDQLKLVSDEAERKNKLLGQGLTNRSEYTALLRSQADLVGQIGAITSQMEQTRTQIAASREQRVHEDTQRIEQALSDLNDVNVSIGQVEEQLSAARDVLERSTVRAPSDGLVLHIDQNTPGSVVRAGEELAQLLPTSSELIVEAHVRPADRDIIRPGQDANLRFVALNMRTTPEVPGTVTFISPDRLVDQASGQAFYLARLKITDELPPEVDRTQIYAGMPVEAMISTGSRTFLQYLAKPLVDSFNRAFREQ